MEFAIEIGWREANQVLVAEFLDNSVRRRREVVRRCDDLREASTAIRECSQGISVKRIAAYSIRRIDANRI